MIPLYEHRILQWQMKNNTLCEHKNPTMTNETLLIVKNIICLPISKLLASSLFQLRGFIIMRVWVCNFLPWLGRRCKKIEIENIDAARNHLVDLCS